MLRRLNLRLIVCSVFILISSIAFAVNATHVDVTAAGAATKLGATVTLTATVTDDGGTDAIGTNNLTGSIAFYDNNVFLGIARTSGTKTTATTTFKTPMLAVGTHPITAKFFSDPGNFSNSLLSGSQDFTVNARGTTATLSSLGSVVVRSTVTATVTVIDEGGASQGLFAASAIYPLVHARHGHTTVLLPQSDGTFNLFVVGGSQTGTVFPAGDPELFSAGAFADHTPTIGSFGPRVGATATLLQDGKVLIAGGFDGTNALATADIYDPVANSVTATGTLQTARQNHAAVLLPNGNVLIIGGSDTAGTALTTPNQVEIYDPTAGTFAKVTGDLGVAAGRSGLTATLLTSGPNVGKILVVGGGPASFEIYAMTGATSGVSTVPVSFTGAPSSHSATLLPDGNVLLAGGGNPSTKNVWLYDAVNNTVVQVTTPSQNLLGTARAGHTATALPDGTAVVIGGLDTTPADLPSAEIYSGSYDPQGPVTLLSSPDGVAADDGNNTLLGCTLSLSGTGSASCTSASVTPRHFGNGSYQITGHYAATTNHTGSDSSSQTLTITKKTLTVQAVTQSKIYDSTTAMNPAQLPNVLDTPLAGDTVTAVQTYADKNASGTPVTITPSVTSIVDGTAVSVIGDYAITLNSIAGGITPRDVTVTAKSGQTKVYGEADPVLDYDVGGNGLAGADLKSDAFTGLLSRAPGQSVSGGPYNIGIGSLVAKTNANSVTNYNMTLYTPATFAIIKRPIGVKVTPGQTKVYGEADPGTLVYTGTALTGNPASGLATNPAFTASGSVDTESAVFTGALTRTAGQAVGSYTITQNSLAVNLAYNNYDFQAVNFVGDLFAITKRPIRVQTTAGQSKVYGQADPATFAFTGAQVTGNPISGLATNPTYTASGVADNEGAVFTGALTRAQAGTNAGQAAGTYAVSQGSVVVNLAYDNYTIQEFGADNFTVNKRPIGAKANPGQTKVYGENDPTFTFAAAAVGGNPVSGLATSNTESGTPDTQNGVFTVGALSRNAGQAVGNYAIQRGSLDVNHNYIFQTADFTSDNFAISKRPIRVQVNAGQAKVYGEADPALTFAGAQVTANPISGLATSNTASGVPDTAAVVFTGALARTAGQSVGTYAIAQNTVAVNVAYDNYNLQEFGSDNFAVTKRPIAAKVNPGQGKVYGEADPATLTFTAAGLTGNPASGLATNPAFTASGLPDNQAGVFAGTVARVAGQAAGSYGINQNTLSVNANYDLQPANFATDNFVISKRPIAVQVNPGQTKVYGESDPSLTFAAMQVSGNPTSGLATSNTASGSPDTAAAVFAGNLARATGQSSGTYAIAQGNLATNNNYDLQAANFSGDNFTISKRPVGVRVNAGQKKIFGQADPASLTFAATTVSGSPASGLAVSNTETGTPDTLPTVFSGSLKRATGEVAGTYAISQNTVAANNNYDLQPVNFVADNFTVTQANTVTAKQTQAVVVNSSGAYKLNINVAYDAAANGGGCSAQLVGTLGCTPDNTVSIKEGSTVLDTQTLVSGAATSKALTLAPGQHVLTITYNAGSNFITSSKSVTLTVAAPLASSISPSTSTSVPVPNVPLGNSETIALPVAGTVSLTSDSSGNALFANLGSTQLGCAVIWSGRTVNLQPTCTVSGAPSSIPAGGSPTVTINIFTSSVHASLQPPLGPARQKLRELYGITVGLPAIVFIGWSVPRRKPKGKPLASFFMLLAFLLALAVLAVGVGCGGGSFDNPANKQPVISASQTETGSYTAVVYYAPAGFATSCAATTCQPQPMATVNFAIAQ